MPSGGARIKSGPTPQASSGRSEQRKLEWTTLPLEGRGRRKVPEFPLDEVSPFESNLWIVLWRKPQAVMWERLGMLFQVAAYTRAFAESTVRDAPASLKVSVLRMEDTLGLSIVGLNALRWRIAEDEVAAVRRRPAVEAGVKPVRRLRVS